MLKSKHIFLLAESFVQGEGHYHNGLTSIRNTDLPNTLPGL